MGLVPHSVQVIQSYPSSLTLCALLLPRALASELASSSSPLGADTVTIELIFLLLLSLLLLLLLLADDTSLEDLQQRL